MVGRLIVILACVALALSAHIKSPKATDWQDTIEDCNPADPGQKTRDETLSKGSSVFHHVTGRVTHDAAEGNMVSCIIVSDNWNDGTNGQVRITEGGRDFAQVIIDAQSQLSRGFSFNVKIYELPKNHANETNHSKLL